MKEFYTIFYPVTGDIRAKKRVKKSEIPTGHFVVFWMQRGLGGSFHLQAIFSSSRLLGNWKNSACEGTQAVLAIPLYRLFLAALINTGFVQKKVGITFTVFEKITKLF